MKPKLLLRLRRGLRRLDVTTRTVLAPRDAAGLMSPADGAWRAMLNRLDREDVERRLAAVERALNGTVDS